MEVSGDNPSKGRLTRRQFVTGAGATAAGAFAAGAVPAWAAVTGPTRRSPHLPLPLVPPRHGSRGPDSLPFPDLPMGTDTMPQIDHILVLMMENHSYDNFLGMLGRGPGERRKPRGDGFTLGRNGLPTSTNPYPNGALQHAFRMPTTCQLDGQPSQEWTDCHVQFDGGRNDGFVMSHSGPVAMGYWTHDDVPWCNSLATVFPLADRWFCSVLGQTYPNRRYLLAATSVGMIDDVISQLTIPAPNGTIWDRLNDAGVEWRNYYSNTPTSLVFIQDAEANLKRLVHMGEFFYDAKTGNLPGFAIIDPNFSTNSEEDPQDIVLGEGFASKVVSAVMDSPAWDRTLLVWTFDEHGGYYDHVPPPTALKPDDIPPILQPGQLAYDGFGRYGFRVPAVVVSPWARKHWVTNVVHDHTSILAMVERKWNLPALTHRDANAADLSDFLDFRHAAFQHPPELAHPADGPPYLSCQKTGPGQIPPPGSITPPPDRMLPP